ncbi:MAG: gephyrin-like molybdotransferase Glp [Candidatus Thermoplasmatota archaeon]|nr:gephyrin-like molybdotransferase Glp [Candidatus Thermoplasmatota archaeon]|tara:strand:- start:3790 stop:4998 length:1209 start_codon:yes stop_codon:yes gene_type:complete
MEVGVSLQRAIELASQLTLVREHETIPLITASGRTLFEDLISMVDDPRFDNSAMDGWAVREADCKKLGAILRIVGTSQAGSEEIPAVNAGEACRIMTGAPIPQGADAIVMVEDSTIVGDKVTIDGPAKPSFIRRKGENLTRDTVALRAGTVLTPASVSLAATMGHANIRVVRKPNIAVIGVGDELTPPGEPLSESSIYESNTFGLSSLVEKMGGTPRRLDLIKDSMDRLRETLDEAAASCDAILTSGGVSMGEWDMVRRIMEEEGDIRFWKVMIKPGGPPIFGSWRGKPIFGLPGNPVSSHIVFTVLVAPWMSFSMGSEEGIRPRLANRVRVEMEESLKGAPGKLCMRRISIRQEGDRLLGSTSTHQGSGNIHSMVAHNGLSLLPPDSDCQEGDTIDALWLL